MAIIRHRHFGERPSDFCVHALAQTIERAPCEAAAREMLTWPALDAHDVVLKEIAGIRQACVDARGKPLTVRWG
jgi:hypothetical protein